MAVTTCAAVQCVGGATALVRLIAKSKPRPDFFPRPGGLAVVLSRRASRALTKSRAGLLYEPSPDFWPGSPPKGTSALGHGHKMRQSKSNRITSLGEFYRRQSPNGCEKLDAGAVVRKVSLLLRAQRSSDQGLFQ